MGKKGGKFVRWFRDISKNDTEIAGGKGASLGEMTQTNIPVPPGFVVLSTGFELFLKENNLYSDIDAVLHTVDHSKVHTVENASEEIEALILNAAIPDEIAKEIMNSFDKL